MNTLLYHLARLVVAALQALPLRVVARLGRVAGGLACWLAARHRRLVLRNLHRCFGAEKTPAEIRALAREVFRRIGENFAGAVKTAAMTADELRPHVTYVVPAELHARPGETPPSVVMAIGHFGNFELYARFGEFMRGYQGATTYRALRQPAFDRLLQELRARSGCLFFERRLEGEKLKAAMNRPGMMLGLLCDQRSGRHAHTLPFVGQPADTSAAVALLALRYKCPLHTAICHRTGLAQWRIEAGPEIPTHRDGLPRPTADIMRDVNDALSAAIRRDPANWFWVHDRWRAARSREQTAAAQPLESAGNAPG